MRDISSIRPPEPASTNQPAYLQHVLTTYAGGQTVQDALNFIADVRWALASRSATRTNSNKIEFGQSPQAQQDHRYALSLAKSADDLRNVTKTVQKIGVQNGIQKTGVDDYNGLLLDSAQGRVAAADVVGCLLETQNVFFTRAVSVQTDSDGLRHASLLPDYADAVPDMMVYAYLSTAIVYSHGCALYLLSGCEARSSLFRHQGVFGVDGSSNLPASFVGPMETQTEARTFVSAAVQCFNSNIRSREAQFVATKKAQGARRQGVYMLGSTAVANLIK